MKKRISIIICLLFLVNMFALAGCGSQEAASDSKEAEKTTEPLKIGYCVSTLNNGFHQAHATWAKKYGEEKYGAEVQVFDGKSDANVMAQNFDQAVAMGMDMVSLHIWQGESIKAAAQEAIDNGMIITTYFDKIPGIANPHIMPGEAEISEQMGKIAAEQWKTANPDKPIVFVCIGWPEHEGVTTGRTDPFVKGVMSVDPNRKIPWLHGCQQRRRCCVQGNTGPGTGKPRLEHYLFRSCRFDCRCAPCTPAAWQRKDG